MVGSLSFGERVAILKRERIVRERAAPVRTHVLDTLFDNRNLGDMNKTDRERRKAIALSFRAFNESGDDDFGDDDGVFLPAVPPPFFKGLTSS